MLENCLRCIGKNGIRAVSIAVLLFFCVVCSAPALAVDEKQTLLTAETPAGAEGDFSAFDVYVGGNYYGVAYGHFGDSWFQADSPADIIKLLPAVKDSKVFLPLLEGKITVDRKVEAVGVVHVDVGLFKISIEVDRAQSLLSGVGKLATLKATDDYFSVAHKTFLAGSTETQKIDFLNNFSLTHDTLLNKWRFSLQSAGNLNQNTGYSVTSLAARKEFTALDQELTMAGGMLQTEGPKFAKNLDFFGLKIGTNTQFIFRDQQGQASTLQLFLANRSKIEIYRDSEATGNILFSRSLDFGTVEIDTRAFPSGSYNIEIVTTGNSGAKSRERRPFTKSASLTPRGAPQFYIGAGVIRNDLKSTDTPTLSLTGKKRLSDNLEGTLAAHLTQDDQIYEVGFNAEQELSLFGAMGMTTLSLTGAIDTLASPAGFEAAASWTGESVSATLLGNKTYARLSANSGFGNLALTDRQSLNFNISAPIPVVRDGARIGFSSEISSTQAGGKKYRYGPALAMDLPSIGNYTTAFKIENVTSESDNLTLASLLFRTETTPWSQTREVLAQHENAGTSLNARAALSFAGAQSSYTDWRQNLRANASLRADPLVTTNDAERTVGFFDSDVSYKAKKAAVLAYLNQNLNEQTGQLGGEVQSTLLWSQPSGITATGELISAEGAFAVLKLSGKEKNKLNIKVNGAVRGYGVAGETVIIPLPVYEESTLMVFDEQGSDSIKIKEKPQKIVSYPGNLIYREFTAVKSYFVTGVLKNKDGLPLLNERFEVNDDVYYTDEQGRFSFESALEEKQALDFSTTTSLCRAVPLTLLPDTVIYDLGEIVCTIKAPVL